MKTMMSSMRKCVMEMGSVGGLLVMGRVGRMEVISRAVIGQAAIGRVVLTGVAAVLVMAMTVTNSPTGMNFRVTLMTFLIGYYQEKVQVVRKKVTKSPSCTKVVINGQIGQAVT